MHGHTCSLQTVLIFDVSCVIFQAGGTPPTTGAHGLPQDPSGSRQVHSSLARPGATGGGRPMASANPVQNGKLDNTTPTIALLVRYEEGGQTEPLLSYPSA